MNVYFARPLDQAHEHSMVLIDQVFYVLAEAKIPAFQPGRPWSTPHDPDPRGRELRALINETAQRGCDATVAVLPDGVPTLGTPAEIERALQWGKPVVIVVGERTAETVQVTEWEREGATVTIHPDDVAAALHEAITNPDPFPDTPALGVKLEGGRLPTRGYDGDAGFDLYVKGYNGYVTPGRYYEIPTEVRLALPPGTWGMLVGRSSSARKGLLIHQAIIDQGYTGPMFFGVTVVGEKAVDVHDGDRLAQIIPMPLLAANMPVVEIDEMPATDRGDAGFGSTGD